MIGVGEVLLVKSGLKISFGKIKFSKKGANGGSEWKSNRNRCDLEYEL